MLFFSNHFIASKLSSSSLLIEEFKFLSQAWNVVGKKLKTSLYLGRKNKSLKYILKKIGPKFIPDLRF